MTAPPPIDVAAALTRLQSGDRLHMALSTEGRRFWIGGADPRDVSEADACLVIPMLTPLGDALLPDPALSQSWELRGGASLRRVL